ncbi:Acyl carrier protein [Chitinophaga terrae (ex Kim and Jung 2007)]|uniref:Acyl carrier protein n=1 Tax=Chitinophaga terrae (ex Kim and Jung 2007) TaxID=408074 RepID=A0A1H3XZ01_9BACT|nr:acyl carrier protein [Chitinophaga terrae (ex Kim and Jung 2007)]GEP89444.1 acyl carrier protein [Chitinophaga terrae (ex Kim and Jung 2007)]SEA03834.1 Acyl carrier protein [Chitinophaga terrae (ex Kim and Jung 2007)]
MTIENFVKKFEEQLEDITPGTITPSTAFKELEEWDSMTNLVIIAMVDREYNKQITGNDLSTATTIQDLYNLINS